MTTPTPADVVNVAPDTDKDETAGQAYREAADAAGLPTPEATPTDAPEATPDATPEPSEDNLWADLPDAETVTVIKSKLSAEDIRPEIRKLVDDAHATGAKKRQRFRTVDQAADFVAKAKMYGTVQNWTVRAAVQDDKTIVHYSAGPKQTRNRRPNGTATPTAVPAEAAGPETPTA